MIFKLEYKAKEFNDINVDLVRHALFTGSQRFFKRGKDLDYVITFENFKNNIPKLFRAYRRASRNVEKTIQHLGERNYPDSFDCLDILVDGSKVNLIIVHGDLQFKQWEFATNCFLRLCRSPAKRILENNKTYRVAIFEMFKKMYLDQIKEREKENGS